MSNQSDENKDSNKTSNDSTNGNISADDIPSITESKGNSKSSQLKTPKSARKTGKNYYVNSVCRSF